MAISESDSMSAYGAAWRAIPATCPFREPVPLGRCAAGDRLAVPPADARAVADDALAGATAERVALDVPAPPPVALTGRQDVALLVEWDGVVGQRRYPAEQRNECD